MAPPRNLGKLNFFPRHFNEQYFLSYKVCKQKECYWEKKKKKKEPGITLGKYGDD